MSDPSLDTELRRLVSVQLATIVRKRLGDDWSSRNSFEQCLREVMRYLVLLSTSKEARFVPLTKDADDVWHELILQTQDYHSLCAALPSGKYLHHTSEEYSEYVAQKKGGDTTEAKTELLRWFADYVNTFGAPDNVSEKYWTPMMALRHSGHKLSNLAEAVKGNKEVR